MAGASVFYPSRSVYPKVIGGSGPVPPAVTPVGVTLDQQNPLVSAQFSPLGEGANALFLSQEKGADLSEPSWAAASDPFPADGNYGQYDIDPAGTAYGVSFNQGFANLTDWPSSSISLALSSFTVAGGAPVSGLEIIARVRVTNAPIADINIAINDTLGNTYETTNNQFPIANNTKNSIVFYIRGGKVGFIINGVDNGYVQAAGVDIVFAYAAKAALSYFINKFTPVGIAGEPQGYLSGNFVLQNTEVLALAGGALPAGPWVDLKGNTVA